LEAVRQGAWKCRLTGPAPELYDMDVDPAEMYDHSSREKETTARMVARMREFARDIGAGFSSSQA
jgi:hypothetical protein